MNPVLKFCLSGLILVGLSACAVGPDPRGDSQADIESAEMGDMQGQTRYVRVTGSRIRYPITDDGQAPLTSFPVIGYSQDDIEFTGVRDMQGALIILDPRID